MADYYYLHEKPKLVYTVLAQPPPADSAKAAFHKNSPAGAVIYTDPALKKQGSGEVTFDLAAHKVELDHSPIFVEFTFRKENVKPPERKVIAVLALAEPEVRTIVAPPEADAGEEVKVVVTEWNALVYDRPGTFGVVAEERPGRISNPSRSSTRWIIDGTAVAVQGEKIKFAISRKWLGRYVDLVAHVTDKNAPRGTASIAVPQLTVIGPERVNVEETIGLTASIAPGIQGTYAWSISAGAERAKIEGPTNGTNCLIAGIEESPDPLDVTVACAFTSEATKRVYKVEHKLTVVLELELAADVEPDEQPTFEVELEDEDVALPVVATEADEDELAFMIESEGQEAGSVGVETEIEDIEPIVVDVDDEVPDPSSIETFCGAEASSPLEPEVELDPAQELELVVELEEGVLEAWTETGPGDAVEVVSEIERPVTPPASGA